MKNKEIINYKSYHFKFYSYDKTMVKNIHKNSNFQTLKNFCLKDTNYALLIIKILKKLASPTSSEQAFMRVCDLEKRVNFDLKKIKMNNDDSQLIFNCLYSISKQEHDWNKFRADLVEYLVYLALKDEGFTVKFEPDIRYKRKPLIKKNKPFHNNKFDIGSYTKSSKKLFVLGECKTSLSGYIALINGKYLLRKNVVKQIKKVKYVHSKIIKSKTKSNEKVFCNTYLFVINKTNKSPQNMPNIEIIQIEDIFIKNFFVDDLVI